MKRLQILSIVALAVITGVGFQAFGIPHDAPESGSNGASLYGFELKKGQQELEVKIDGSGKAGKQAAENDDDED